MARVLIVNPFASGVTERKLASVQAALPNKLCCTGSGLWKCCGVCTSATLLS